MSEVSGIGGANSAPQVQNRPIEPQNAPSTAGAIENFKSQLVDIARNGSAVEAGKAKAELDKLTGSRAKTESLVNGGLQSAAREFGLVNDAASSAIKSTGAALGDSVRKQ